MNVLAPVSSTTLSKVGRTAISDPEWDRGSGPLNARKNQTGSPSAGVGRVPLAYTRRRRAVGRHAIQARCWPPGFARFAGRSGTNWAGAETLEAAEHALDGVAGAIEEGREGLPPNWHALRPAR